MHGCCFFFLFFWGGACYFARQLLIPFHSTGGKSMWFWGCEMERPARGSEDAKRSDAPVAGMRDFTEGFVPRSCGCRGAHPCRAAARVRGSVCQPASARWQVRGLCAVCSVREVGQSPLGWQVNCWVRNAPGPAQENVLIEKDFNFFPFLSKLSALMESLVQAEAPRAPVEPFCAVLLTPVVNCEPHTPARC